LVLTKAQLVRHDWYRERLLERRFSDVEAGIYRSARPVEIACLENPSKWQIFRENASYAERPRWAQGWHWEHKQKKNPDGTYTLWIRYVG
jgi:hypothetical protein